MSGGFALPEIPPDCRGGRPGFDDRQKEMRKFVGGKPRAIAADTYKKFARKYGIKTGGPLGRTAQKIYDHEHRAGVQRGLYFQPKK